MRRRLGNDDSSDLDRELLENREESAGGVRPEGSSYEPPVDLVAHATSRKFIELPVDMVMAIFGYLTLEEITYSLERTNKLLCTFTQRALLSNTLSLFKRLNTDLHFAPQPSLSPGGTFALPDASSFREHEVIAELLPACRHIYRKARAVVARNLSHLDYLGYQTDPSMCHPLALSHRVYSKDCAKYLSCALGAGITLTGFALTAAFAVPTTHMGAIIGGFNGSLAAGIATCCACPRCIRSCYSRPDSRLSGEQYHSYPHTGSGFCATISDTRQMMEQQRNEYFALRRIPKSQRISNFNTFLEAVSGQYDQGNLSDFARLGRDSRQWAHGEVHQMNQTIAFLFKERILQTDKTDGELIELVQFLNYFIYYLVHHTRSGRRQAVWFHRVYLEIYEIVEVFLSSQRMMPPSPQIMR